MIASSMTFGECQFLTDFFTRANGFYVVGVSLYIFMVYDGKSDLDCRGSLGKAVYFEACGYLRSYIVGLVGRVFTNGPRDRGSIPDRVTPKSLKMVLDTSLLNTQHYKVLIKGKVEQSRERSSILLYTLV